MRRPSEARAAPDSYSRERCLACGETVRRPHWDCSSSGGAERRIASASAGNPARVSKYWEKRRVTLEVSTLIGSIGAQHYYFKLKEDDDYPLVIDDDYPGKKGEKNVVVFESFPKWNDAHRGREAEDNRDNVTRDAAIAAAMEAYRSAFDCHSHYLVMVYRLVDSEDERKVKALFKGLREGD